MKTAYLAISYICNQKCSFCPCTKEEKTFHYMDYSEITNTIDQMMNEVGIDEIVLSGGEPTIHPQFLEILRYLSDKKIKVTVLTNAERLFDKAFVKQITQNISYKDLTIITTIHSQKEQLHENVNLSKGSFNRSIEGLKNISREKVHTIVKHCITKENYRDLKAFYVFVNSSFAEDVDIQLCSIDYCGLDNLEKNNYKVSFPEIREYMEDMLDTYISDCKDGNSRLLYCFNMPLCAADPYYWRYFTSKAYGYDGYASPNREGNSKMRFSVDTNVGTYAEACKKCIASKLCAGTYKTAFELFGDSIVKAYT